VRYLANWMMVWEYTLAGSALLEDGEGKEGGKGGKKGRRGRRKSGTKGGTNRKIPGSHDAMLPDAPGWRFLGRARFQLGDIGRGCDAILIQSLHDGHRFALCFACNN
jgi:hypothetical protein